MHRERFFDNVPSHGNVCQKPQCIARAWWSTYTQTAKRSTAWRDLCDRHFAEELRKEGVSRISIRAEQTTSLTVG